MEDTIKLISKYDWTLVEVIQWLDSNGHSDTEIRSKVDTMLNFEKDIKKGSEMELTKISLKG
jgi:outer membrane protease|tara:strand:+ start:337 stop:522 length:186 start_codon:yes stop_codon:yes gene_type:complete